MQHPNHPDHDLTLIAAHAAGDLAGAEGARAQTLLDACTACADLHRDLIAIASATRDLPTLATAPRDFRLSPEQAARLGRTGWLRTILAPFGSARSATRPIAAAFTSLGLAGLLVATFLPGMLGSAASAPAGAARDQGSVGAAPTAALAAPVVGVGQPGRASASGAPDDAFGVKDGATATSAPEVAFAGGSATQWPGEVTDADARVRSTLAPNPLFIGSLALFALGLLLFGLRIAGRRLR